MWHRTRRSIEDVCLYSSLDVCDQLRVIFFKGGLEDSLFLFSLAPGCSVVLCIHIYIHICLLYSGGRLLLFMFLVAFA